MLLDVVTNHHTHVARKTTVLKSHLIRLIYAVVARIGRRKCIEYQLKKTGLVEGSLSTFYKHPFGKLIRILLVGQL